MEKIEKTITSCKKCMYRSTLQDRYVHNPQSWCGFLMDLCLRFMHEETDLTYEEIFYKQQSKKFEVRTDEIEGGFPEWCPLENYKKKV
jgi:hypothetical protein